MQTWNRRRQNSQLLKRLALLTFLLAVGIFIRQTQGNLLLEVYYWLNQPFEKAQQNRNFQQNLVYSSRIQELEIMVQELEEQNANLQKLLDFSKTIKKTGVSAPVVGRSADQWWEQITLGRGSQDGIKVGHVVMAVGGLVGRITEVTPHTSRVLMISDSHSRIGVAVARSRQMGFMKGQGAEQQKLGVVEFFDDVPDVKPGDVVSTSAYSQLFPPGLPIGKVKSVSLSKTPAPGAIIELSAPIEVLEWVMVYLHQPISD